MDMAGRPSETQPGHPQSPDTTLRHPQIEPTTFRTWIRILAKLPKAILWLLASRTWARPTKADRR